MFSCTLLICGVICSGIQLLRLMSNPQTGMSFVPHGITGARKGKELAVLIATGWPHRLG